MTAAPVVILCEPSDESLALTVARLLEGRGVGCWVEGVEGREGPSRSEALAACRAVVVLVDEGGGAYGALDAGATWAVPVFVLGRRDHDARERLRAFCDRVAAVAQPGPARPSLDAASRRWMLGGAGLMAAALLGGVLVGRGSRPEAGKPRAGAGDPVKLIATPSGSGWMLVFQLPAPASEVWYELSSSPGFRSTGPLPGSLDPATGAPLAKTHVMLGRDEASKATTVRVKFRRPGGAVEGPFELPFDPAAQSLAWAKSTLDDTAPHWVSFRSFDRRLLVYFSTLLVYKHALRAINVGLDDGPLDRPVRFVPSEVPGVDGSHDEVFRALPPGTRSVSVELVFRDGSRSQVRTYRVQAEDLPGEGVPEKPEDEGPRPVLVKPRVPRPREPGLEDPWQRKDEPGAGF